MFEAVVTGMGSRNWHLVGRILELSVLYTEMAFPDFPRLCIDSQEFFVDTCPGYLFYENLQMILDLL